MALIVCTPGGASDNCYVTLAQADAYVANTLRADDWALSGDTDREKALIQATAEIEALGGAKADDLSPTRALFRGTPYATTEDDGGTMITSQALHFPRTTDVDGNSTVFIPQALRDAVCEQALWLLERLRNPPLVDRQGLRSEGVKNFALDGHSETLGSVSRPPGIAPAAWRLVRQFVVQGGRTRTK